MILAQVVKFKKSVNQIDTLLLRIYSLWQKYIFEYKHRLFIKFIAVILIVSVLGNFRVILESVLH